MKKNVILSNWKLGLHLILNTNYLGVNNSFLSRFRSIWGKPFISKVFNLITVIPIIYNIKLLRWRMGKTVGFVPPDVWNKS